ncbi:hypothetical protein GALMADRAFT_148369 [Galerina marginata CBS 339.88]|uniref:Mob1/phocein n=1 Tax=Galerina marginata (strain CBS 339.88) TaxID=685588 RepID=A0A067SG89_GALM3|nr:hypothetical protein GALMADRAFT_148369 [Galerina marginata CBS 339.88]
MAVVIQRPLRGSRISTFYPVKNLPSLASLDSAFQLQEYISLLIRLDVHDVDAIVSLPGTSSRDKDSTSEQEKAEPSEEGKDAEKDTDKGKNEVTVDEACWIYEHLRRLAQDLSHPLITTLQQECTRASCPEMKAGEWLYLCVAHGNDGAMEQCCAIDYILHTVDSATALLNSPRTFPSRLSIPQTSHRHFSSLARRLGRIFAHAYFHHREAFEQAEAESSLYARFLALTAKFDLVPAEFLVIPSAQFSGDDSGANRDRDFSHHEYNPPRYPSSKTSPELHNPGNVAQKYMQQHQLGVDRSRSPNPPGLGSEVGGGNGGIGETPSSTSRSRFGRNRTDTMVFTDAEASAVADELAAKAKAGELEADYEHEGPKTARPGDEPATEKELEEDEPDLDGETQFEISLSPEEEILGTLVDIKGVPTYDEMKEEHPKASTSDLTPSEPLTILEKPPAEEEEPEKTVETVPERVIPLIEVENVEEEKTVEPIPPDEVKAPEPAIEEPVSEEEPAAVPPPSTETSTPAPAPDEPKDIIPEEKAPQAEPAVETPAPAPEPPVVDELATAAKPDPVEPSTTPPPPEVPLPDPELTPSPAPPTELLPELPTLDAHTTVHPSHPVEAVEAVVTEPTQPEETVPPVEIPAETESGHEKPEVVPVEASVEVVKEEAAKEPEVVAPPS